MGIREHHPFLGQCIDMGRVYPAALAAIAIDIPDTEVIRQNENDTRRAIVHRKDRQGGQQRSQKEK